MKTSKRISAKILAAPLPSRAIQILLVVLTVIIPATILAQLGKLGAMGDSLTDEYWEGQAAYAKNWPELLVEYTAQRLHDGHAHCPGVD